MLNRTQQRVVEKVGIYVLLLIGGIIFLAPFLFMVLSSLKSMEQISRIPIEWWPNPVQFQNYAEAFRVQPMARYFLNSTIITSFTTVGMVISCTLAGWGFSRPYFWGRNFLFMLILAMVMIPSQVTMIPLYIIFSKLGWIDTFLPLIVPAFFAATTPYYIFLVRQFFLSIPYELYEAAVIDGCSPWKTFWHIGVPLIKPAVVTVAVFTVMFSWSNFFSHLIYLNSQDKFTVPLGLTAFQGEGGIPQWDLLMPASTVALLPVLLVFLFFQRYYVKGLASTGLKE